MSELRIGLIYIRQSRHKDSERTVSPEVQEAACRALPAIQSCDPVEVYVDLDKSGKSIAKRPDFQRFLDRIVTDPPAVIAVYDQSRSFRNTTEALDFYALMERMPQVTVAFHLGHFERSPVGEFSYTALAAAHTMERKMTGAKISEAKRYAAGKGEMVGAVPAGYHWEGSGRDRQLAIDEETAPVVRRIFDEYATGHYSTREIARRLNAEGVRLPRFTGGWRQDTVAQILGNVSYISMTYVNRTKKEGELIRGQWPELIDGTTWVTVQRMLDRYHRKGGRKPAGQERAYVFQGLLRCLKCGRRMHCHPMKGRAYYHCRGNDNPDPCRRLVREDRLLPWAEALLAALDRDRPDDLAEAVAERSGTGRSRHRSKDAIAQLDASLARLGKRFEWGHIDEDAYRAEWARLRAQREELVTRTAERALPPLPLGSLMEGWATGDPRTRRGLLAVFFDEIDIVDQEIVSVVPRKQYAAEVVALLDKLDDQYCGCSPGGIRTRDLSLERAAS